MVKQDLFSDTFGERKDPKLTLRIIRRCNFCCPACSTFSGPNRKGIMSLSDFVKIVRVLDANDFCGVLNISGGEPTLHPELSRMVSFAARSLRKARIAVFTNGDWVGQDGWREFLSEIMAGSNILIRFSLDSQHAEGKAIAEASSINREAVEEIEKERFAKARDFLDFCLQEKAVPGLNFDFAFKGTTDEARIYMETLGSVPVYPIEFQRNPSHRPSKKGFFAVDLDETGRAFVYLTLGDILYGDSMGGIESLPLALRINRDALAIQRMP